MKKCQTCSGSKLFDTGGIPERFVLKVEFLKKSAGNKKETQITQNAKTSSGRVAQSVTCLATDACLTADPGVASSIPVLSHSFVEIDHEIISTVILLPSADLFKKGCWQ